MQKDQLPAGKELGRRNLLAIAGCSALLATAPAVARQAQNTNVVATLALLVEREYPDATTARNLATMLRTNLRNGRYRSLRREQLADRLTADMREFAHDKHLKVEFDPEDAKLRTPALAGTAAKPYETPRTPSPNARAVFAPQGYGIVKAELLEGNIGVLQVDTFAPLYDLVRARIASAMDILSDSFALILDLRRNGGGTADSPAYLLSYFFDRDPFVLNRLVWRNLPPEVIQTTRDLIGRSYGEKRPLIVATSGSTFSAAEAVAYSLQSTKRATIVGQRTRGGANPGDYFSIGDGFVAFCPQGRAIDGVTGGNWEGTGVVPDVTAEPAVILNIAHRVAATQALAQATAPDAIDLLRKAIASGPYPAGV